jgi:deoxyribodipyrimidine photo-lyase
MYPGIHPARVTPLNRLDSRDGRFVLYWMQQSQRAGWNHALEYAVHEANRLNQGVVVGFGLMRDYPEANQRHYAFMLEGLQETADELASRGIAFVMREGSPGQVALTLARHASAIVCDRGYLRHQKQWRRHVADRAGCRVVQVESDAIVPVNVASGKADYAARTFRPKVMSHLDEYLLELPPAPVGKTTLRFRHDLESDVGSTERLLRERPGDSSVRGVGRWFRGGASRARSRFESFLEGSLERYRANRNQPQTGDTACLSPYLHFGQVSPLELALRIQPYAAAFRPEVDVFLEELVVRRELAINFTEYTEDYDSYTCLPSWAVSTLERHRSDPRPHLYSDRQLEDAATHDPYWNAAMAEMRHTGFMHNYMRMYWGKKILEWSNSPENAYGTALSLNNRYFLDGRDPNSFAGVAWIFGLHDRPWGERPIYGTVRSMTAGGLERKCDIRAYVRRVREAIES